MNRATNDQAKRSSPVTRHTRFLLIAMTAVFFSLAGTAHAATSATFFGKMYTGDGGSALAAYLDMPKGVAVKTDGTAFIADTLNNVIRAMSAKGIITTYSGTGDYGKNNGARIKATWSEPEGIAIDPKGVLYIADTGSNLIRKIHGNAVSTIPLAGLKRPTAIIVSGNTLFIADTGNNRIVSASTKGGKLTVLKDNVKTPLKLAVSGNTLYAVAFDAGKILAINIKKKTTKVLASGFIEPRALALADGALFVTAGPSGIYNELWRINISSGTKTRLMRERETELLNQTADVAPFTLNGIQRLLLLQLGGSSIYSVSLQGTELNRIAGRHRFGDEPGAKNLGLLGRPKALVVSHDAKKIYVSYAQGNKIAVYDVATGVAQPLAGHLMDNYREDAGSDARFSDAAALAIAPDDATLYLVDRNNQRIRALTVATGETRYITGAGVTNLLSPTNTTGQIDPNFQNGYQEGRACPETFTLKAQGCAYFSRPAGLAITKNGKTLYVADTGNQRIRKVDIATGSTTFIAGSGKKQFKDGVGAKAGFADPSSIALSADEKTLFVTDKSNHAIRQVNLATKKVTTLAGTGKAGYKEGTFSQTMFSIPEYIVMGPKNILYVAEAGSLRVRALNLATKQTSLVSGSGQRGMRNGATFVAKWNVPKGMAFFGNRLLVADFQNDLIRSLNLGGN